VEAVAGEARPRTGEDVQAALCEGLLAEAGHNSILNENDHLRYGATQRTFGLK